MKDLTIIFLLFFSLSSCNKKKELIKPEEVKMNFDLEKIVIINLNEACLTYFKVKINNPSSQEVVLQDNSLKDALKSTEKVAKRGFYLKNTENENIIPLGIDNYYFFETGKKNSSYYFICAYNLENTFKRVGL